MMSMRIFCVFCLLTSKLSFSYAQKNENQVIDLCDYEKQVFSQYGEDGVIEALFTFIEPTSFFAVEFGCLPNDYLSNTRYLYEKGWKRVCWDGSNEDHQMHTFKEWITKDNINELFDKYHVPEDVDFVSIDIDNNDFYVWLALKYRPKVVCIECNIMHPTDQDKLVPYKPNYLWDGSHYFGASPLALLRLGQHKGYSLVFMTHGGANMFFVRNDLLKNLQFKNCNNVKPLHRAAQVWPEGTHLPFYTKKYTWISSKEAMQVKKSSTQ